MERSNFATLSNSHLMEQTIGMLAMECWKDDGTEMGIPVFEKGQTGFFVYISASEITTDESGDTKYRFGSNVPEDLQSILEYCVHNDIELLVLDPEGEIIPSLPTYEW